MTLSTFEDVWITLMLTATLMAQAHTAMLTPDEMALLHQLRARLQTAGPAVVAALADLEEGL
jgi:hypothetical protein